ncbi:hypothetical protein Q3G72_029207 [Acer saccharum]|nr:hypothetical protein Q3G72_029207 [Acer saccharum]
MVEAHGGRLQSEIHRKTHDAPMKAPKEKRIDLEDRDASVSKRHHAGGKAKITNTLVHHHMEIMGETDRDQRNPTCEKLALQNCEVIARRSSLGESRTTRLPAGG